MIRQIFICFYLVTVHLLFAQSEILTEITRWPNGPSQISVTNGDTLAFVGNGSAIDILSIADVTHPILVGRVLLPALPVDVVYHNGLLYVLTNSEGMIIYDVQNLKHPLQRGTYDIGDTPHNLALYGNYLLATYEDYGLAVLDITNPDQPQEVSQVSVSGSAYGLFVRDTLVFVTRELNGLGIFNFSDPANPTLLGEVDTYEAAYDVYVQGNYAYVADFSGVEVVDVTNPAAPTLAKRLALNEGIMSITGDGSDRLWTGSIFYGVTELDISNPADIHIIREYPSIQAYNVWRHQTLLMVPAYNQGFYILQTAYIDSLRQEAHYVTGWSTTDVAIRDSLLFVANWENGLYVVKWQNTPYPRILSHLPSRNESHSVDVDGNVLYLADGSGFLRKVDVTDPENPKEIGYFDYGVQISSYHVQVGERFVYVSCGYNGWHAIDRYGLGSLKSVLHWSNPDAYVYKSYVLNDTLVAIATGDQGLYLLNIADTSQVIQLAQFKEDNISVSAVFLQDHYAFINNGNYFYVLDITDPNNPVLTSTFDTGNTIYDIKVKDGKAYLANSYNGLLVLDVSDPANPVRVGEFSAWGSETNMIKILNNTILMANGEAGVSILQENATGIEKTKPLVTTFWLEQNFPNPFNPETTIRFWLPTAASIELVIFNVLGQQVRTLSKGWLSAGQHQVRWDGRDNHGKLVGSGLYLYRLKTPRGTQIRKMFLLK